MKLIDNLLDKQGQEIFLELIGSNTHLVLEQKLFVVNHASEEEEVERTPRVDHRPLAVVVGKIDRIRQPRIQN